jgi:predicted helicase
MIKRDKFRKEKEGKFLEEDVWLSNYRPYSKQFLYFGYIPIDLKGSFKEYFPNNSEKNKVINFSGLSSSQDFQSLATETLTGLDFLEKTKSIGLYFFNDNGEKIDNITDWGHKQFTDYYKDKKIKKEDIFNYTYAVLHNPAYRKKYELNLKREFPRLPFYKDFWQWAKWGKALMDLHINYEEAKPFKLNLSNSEAIIKELKKAKQEELSLVAEAKELYLPPPSKIKVKLKADKILGEIELDENSVLKGIPKEAWEYKLGNRSALEWILDQYKEKKYSDPTVAEKFNTYRFADYKEKVIDLLKRVTTVSVETMKIIREMEAES